MASFGFDLGNFQSALWNHPIALLKEFGEPAFCVLNELRLFREVLRIDDLSRSLENLLSEVELHPLFVHDILVSEARPQLNRTFLEYAY